MNRIRGGATALGVAALATAALLLAGGVARAQETTGRVTGRVTDKDSGAPLGGVTVVAQGERGEDATITDSKGDYYLTNLPVGTYAIRFYVANTAAEVQQPGVVVSAEKTVRVNAKIASSTQAAAQQTYVITGRPPAVDVGSARVGATFDESFNLKVPNGLTFGDVISKAPGAFIDPSGNVSIGGATGLENIYMVNGLNVTGTEYGNLESGAASLSGGTNLPLEFLTQIDVSSGGYQAEYGGAMGGVISTVLKSGTNQLHGSVFTTWAPYQLSANPNFVLPVGSAIGGVRKPDFDTNIGVEVGGPIIKDKLFFWIGLAPRFTNSHVFRLTYAQQEATDMNGVGTGMPVLGADGNPTTHELTDWRARINETHQTYSYAATVDWVPAPEHRLTFAAFGTPSFNTQLRNVFNGQDIASNPEWARESLTKTNSDVTLRWVSKLFNRHWLIEANAGVHREDFNDRSPNPALNGTNQLEVWGSNLWDLEHAPGCEPTASGFQPCPVNPNYHTGGFGLVKEYTAQRWMGELKSTHLFEALGHHEIKYGWRMEYTAFDQDRYYSGPPGGRALIQLAPNGGAPVGLDSPYYNTWTFFTLQPGEFPTDYGPGAAHPASDLLYDPRYRDHLKADVTSLSNAFFLQEGYTPDFLRNLTVNVGARLELQRLTDTYGQPFLDTKNLGPRLGAVYDPFNDGRSKISASYGRYFEAIPLATSARYFGGEGILIRNGLPFTGCGKTSASEWTGAGEWKNCPAPAMGDPNDNAAGGSAFFNNGANYPVQTHLQGQYHNEVVATVEREVMEDLTLRVDYIHRWLGTIIEDGATDPNSLMFVLANPGNVPKEALDDAQREVDQLQAQSDDMMTANNTVDPHTSAALTNAQAKLATLKGLAAAPKPERTYDAITLSVNKRFSKAWFARAAYTYSRLIGNYEGLYQAEQNYFQPNGNNAYDTPDLYNNARGPLPNDRPHQGRVDGYYTVAAGRGTVTVGLSFSARSGMPRNYMSQWYGGNQLNFLLPRGSAGRTPPITQFDGRISYNRALSATVNLEAFVSLFNILNQQTALMVDDNYTYELSAPIVNGTPDDLRFAKNNAGQPVAKNPNYGRALSYQAPFNTRLGVRMTF